MSDVNANIGVHIDTSAALAQLKNLQRQISTFHSQVSKSSATAAMAQKNLQNNLLNAVNATGKFHAQMGVVRTSTESFTNALEKNKLSMRDYFRFAGGASKSFGKLFKSEFDTIGKVAEDRVKKMQTQYIKMGRDASGAMRAMSITPNTLNMQDYATKTALAAQRQALFNQLVKQGSTNLLNFGKNTQWAGRQLMVGFSVPLLYIGTAAGKVFMDLEQQALKFKRVYGDMFTTTDETNKALKDIELLAKEFTKYGVAVSKTMEMAASAAAMGQTGAELTAQVAQATRLAVLGNVEQEQALQTTISLTSAFGLAAEDLASKIDFLNSVENQTIVSIEDLTVAVPKAGPVVKQLGGDVEDLAFFLTAMKEGGINASEGANALKSGLAALINPTGKASDMLNAMGVNINKIVESNQGDIKNTVIEFAQALDTLAPLDRSRAIEQLFGKFQFARLSTLFQNITKEGTQANRVLELSKMEVEELAILSERELKTIENAVGTNFKEAVETLKLTIAPIGKTFLEAVTPVIKAVAGLLEKFNGLGDGTKKFLVIASTFVGIIGPALLMAFGLVANGAANIIKLFLGLRSGFLKLGGNSKILAEQTNYLNSEQLEAATVAASLNQAHTTLTQSFTLETSAVKALRAAYVDATIASANFARSNPGMMMPGFKPGGKGTKPKGFASGTTGLPGPKGAGDIIPILGAPGEAIIPADVSQDKRFKPLIAALVSGDIKGYEKGTTGLTFDGKEYNAKTAQSQKSIKSFLDSLIKNSDGTLTHIDSKTKEPVTFTKTRLQEVLDGRYARLAENKFTLSEIKEKLSIGGVKKGSGISSSKGWISTLTQKAGYPNMLAEQQVIEQALKKQGLNPSQDQRRNLFQTQASHLVQEIGPDGKKIFKAANIVPDAGYINNYVNTVKGKLGKELLAMTDDQLKSLNIDKAELKKIASGTHPTTANAANTLRNIAQYQIGQNPSASGIYQAQAVAAGIDYRMKNSFYKGGLKTIAQLFPTNKNVIAELAVQKGEGLKTATGKTKTVTGQTGKAKPSGRNITDSPSDTRVIPKKSVRRVIPIRGFRVAGAKDGYDDGSGVAKKVSGRSAPSRSEVLSGIAIKQSTEATEKQTKQIKDNSVATKENAKQTKLSKENVKAFGAKANVGVGALSGLTIAASFAGGKVGEMAQKIMPFIFGLQGVLMLLPLLMNPLVGLPLAIGAVVAGIWLFKKKQDDAIKAEARLVDELYATSQKMQSVGEIFGNVGASQLAARKRESAGGDFSFERKGIKAGSTFLQSEVGKADIAAFEARFKAMPDIAMKEFSLKLASYVSDGVIDAAQAASIADQVGIEFQDKVLGIKIQGQLQRLLTVDGKDITQEPFEIRIKIAEETIDQFTNIAPNLKEQLAFAEKEFSRLGEIIGSPVVTEGLSDEEAEKANKAWDEANANYDEAKKKIDEINSALKQYNAFSAAMASQSFESIQAQIDAIDVSTSKTIDKLKAEKAATKDLAAQALIQKEIDRLETKKLESVIKLRNMNKQVTKGIEDQLKLAKNERKLGEFFLASSEAIKTRFKGTKQETDANVFLDRSKAMGETTMRANIEATVSSGQLGPAQATSFLNLFAGDEKGLKETFDTFLNVQGMEDLNKLQSILGGFEDQELAKEIMVNMSGLTDAEFQAQYSTLELLMQMDNEEINIELVLKDPEVLAKITKINAAIEAMPNVTKKEVEAVLTTAGFPAGGLEKISENWEYFAGLPSELRKTALQTFTTLHATIFANNESKQEWARQQAEAASGGIGNEQARNQIRTLTYTTIIDTKTGGFTAEGEKKAKAGVLEQVKDIIGIQQMYEKMLNSKGGGGGGTGTRNAFLDSLLDKLRRVRDASIDTQSQLKGLREVLKKAGGDIKVFDGLDQQLSKLKAPQEFIDFIASLDPKGKKGGIESLATYLDTEQLSKGIVKLTKDGKLLLNVFREGVIGDFESDLRKATNGLIAQKEQFILLNGVIGNTELSAEMLGDANFAIALSSAKTTTEVNRLVAAFKAQKAAQEDLAMTQDPIGTLQDKLSDVTSKAEKFFSLTRKSIEANFASRIFVAGQAVDVAQKNVEAAQKEVEKIQDTIDNIQSSIDKKQRDIEENITRPIEEFQKEISAIQDFIRTTFDEPIAALQQESSDLSNDLTLIDRAADAINKKYDAQEEALNKIAEINQDIIAQEKTRLSLADALTSGDISAAVQAAQDMRAASAQSAAKGASGALEQARKLEIDSLRSASGMTRDQIEERQFKISQQIFNLEKQRAEQEKIIEAIKRDKILPLEKLREEILKSIRAEEDKIYEITKGALKAAQDKLKEETDSLNNKSKKLQEIEDLKKAELEKLYALELEWIEIDRKIAAAEATTIDLQKEIEEATRLSELLAKEFDNLNKVIGAPVTDTNALSPSALAAAESGAIGAASIRSQSATPGASTAAPNKLSLVKQLTDNTKLLAESTQKVKTVEQDIEKLKSKTVLLSADILKYTNQTNEVLPTKISLWEQVKNAIAVASEELQSYFSNLQQSLSAAQNLLNSILALNTTVVTTHIINTVTTGSTTVSPTPPGSPATPGSPDTPGGGIGGGPRDPLPVMYGGKIKAMSFGGRVGSDFVPALLTPGEFVVNKESSKRFGPLLNKINESKFPSLLKSNYSQEKYNVPATTVISSPSESSVNSVSNNSNTVYNYSVGISVGGSSSSPDTIARAVMEEIKYYDSQRINKQVV